MHKHPIGLGVLLVLTVCANPPVRAQGADDGPGAYRAPADVGRASGQPAPVPAPGGGYQVPGYSGPAYGQPGAAPAPGAGDRPPGYSGPGPGYGYAPQGGYGPGNGQRPGPGGDGPGYNGPPYGGDQPPPRAGGNGFNPMKNMPNPMKAFGGNRNN